MLFSYEFSKKNDVDKKIIFNNEFFKLSNDNTKFIDIEPSDIGHISKPLFINGTDHYKEKIEGIFKNTKRILSSKKIAIAKNCSLVGFNLIQNHDSNTFTSLDGIENQDFFIKKHLPNHSGYQLQTEEGRTTLFFKKNNKAELKGTALVIHGFEGRNYGAFLFRFLPQLLIIKEQQISFDYIIVPYRTPWILHTISLLDFGLKPIYSAEEVQGCKFGECISIACHDNRGFLSAQDVVRIRNFRNSHIKTTTDCFEKIYVKKNPILSSSRTQRVLLNEDNVIEHLAMRGYKPINPEHFTFTCQINIFLKAKKIIGPSGSGMLNSIFSNENTSILELESIPSCTNQHASIYTSTNKKFALFLGEEITPPEWMVHLESLKKTVNIFDEI